MQNSGIFVLPWLETLGDKGLCFATRDPIGLSESLLKVLEDKRLRRRMSATAREIVEERFTWHSVLARLEELYAEVVD
jgi:glycosyltransferase involved in cell wall biosynthesis